MRDLLDITEAYLESGRAPVYHWTNPESARYILEKGKITASLFGVGQVCVTRDKNFQFNKNCVRIEIDSDEVRHNLKVTPFDYSTMTVSKTTPRREEKEERIHGDVSIRAIKGITVFDNGFIFTNDYWTKQTNALIANAKNAGIPLTVVPMKVQENELNEVKMIDDFGDEGYQMERVFSRWTIQGADGTNVGNISGYDILQKDGGTDRTFLFLFKDGECAGRATVDVARGMENTVKMAHIVIHPDLRRKGLGIGLYEYVLQSNDIVSDYDQTRFGRAIWQELARRHVVRPLEIDGSLSEPITNTDQVYGTHTRMVASKN